jgi:hypothetical protein
VAVVVSAFLCGCLAFLNPMANIDILQPVSMLRVLVLQVCKLGLQSTTTKYNDMLIHLCSGFIGFPSVGKSTLMSKLTGQHSEGR